MCSIYTSYFWKKMHLFFASFLPHFLWVAIWICSPDDAQNTNYWRNHKTDKTWSSKGLCNRAAVFTRLPSYFCIISWGRNKSTFLNHCIWRSFFILSQLIPNKNILTMVYFVEIFTLTLPDITSLYSYFLTHTG